MSMENKKTMRLRKSSLRVLNQIETKLVGGGTHSDDFSCNGGYYTVTDPGDYTFRDIVETDLCPPWTADCNVTLLEGGCIPETRDICYPPTQHCSQPDSIQGNCPMPL